MKVKNIEEICLCIKKIVELIGEYQNHENKVMLQEYILLYNELTDALIKNDAKNIKNKYEKVSSLGRCFLETSSDWKAPFLYEMSELTKMMSKIEFDDTASKSVPLER